MTMQTYKTPAVVVGLCTHGLAICRSLGRKGIPVFAIESDVSLPGLKTRFAETITCRNVNGDELIEDLLAVRKRFDCKPVLFLTNDNMVRTITNNIDVIGDHYSINLPQRHQVYSLLDKSNLSNLAKLAGISYPVTVEVSTIDDLEAIRSQIKFPLAIKPTAPLSPFKALRIDDYNSLKACVFKYQDNVERFLIQQWIPGDETRIYFANFYFDQDSRALATFIGKKIRSFPRFTGGACSAEPADRLDILALCQQFFETNNAVGPVSLEIKETADGEKYFIEPTVGRFDYYILCCIANGVNMPFIQYAHQTSHTIPATLKTQCGNTVWMDFGKDFQVFVESLIWGYQLKAGIKFLLRKKAYALWSSADIRPSLYAWPIGIKKVFKKITGA